MASEAKQKQRKRRTRVRMENGQGQVRSVREPKCTATSYDSHRSGLRLCMNFSSAILAPSHTSRRSVLPTFFYINWCHRSTTLHTRQRRARKSFCCLGTTLAKRRKLCNWLWVSSIELSENNKTDRLEEMTTLHILRFKAATSESSKKPKAELSTSLELLALVRCHFWNCASDRESSVARQKTNFFLLSLSM